MAQPLTLNMQPQISWGISTSQIGRLSIRGISTGGEPTWGLPHPLSWDGIEEIAHRRKIGDFGWLSDKDWSDRQLEQWKDRLGSDGISSVPSAHSLIASKPNSVCETGTPCEEDVTSFVLSAIQLAPVYLEHAGIERHTLDR